METHPDGGQTSQASFSWAPLCSTRLSKSGPDWNRAGKDEDHTQSTLYISLHLFTSCNENRHAKCPKDANSEFGQSDTPQAKQNRTGSIFQVGRHWTKEIQRNPKNLSRLRAATVVSWVSNAELETWKSWKNLEHWVNETISGCPSWHCCRGPPCIVFWSYKLRHFLVVRLPQLGEVFRGLCRSSNSRPRASGNTLFGHGYISHSNGWEVWFSHDGYRALSESIPKLPESEDLYTEMSEMLM